tara:strand:+ start:871 stop:1152 length:282 start_codon:yes stop_codon:yes gene_type:complete
LSKSELIQNLKKKNPKLSLSEIEDIFNIFCKSIRYELKKNKRIELRGFGIFFIKEIREKYSARNPKTGELIYVPKKNKVRFRSSKNFNKEINE